MLHAGTEHGYPCQTAFAWRMHLVLRPSGDEQSLPFGRRVALSECSILTRIFLVRHGRSTWNDAKTRRRFDTMLLQAWHGPVRTAQPPRRTDRWGGAVTYTCVQTSWCASRCAVGLKAPDSFGCLFVCLFVCLLVRWTMRSMRRACTKQSSCSTPGSARQHRRRRLPLEAQLQHLGGLADRTQLQHLARTGRRSLSDAPAPERIGPRLPSGAHPSPRY